MNTGQTLLTIGALMVLSTILLRVNNNFVSTDAVMMENRFGVLAISLATSYIEEASGKAFDANTITAAASSTSDLSSLGPGSGESYPNFNDFDDYDGLSIVDSSMKSAIFDINCDVDFVQASNPDKAVTNKTWHKKITVQVTSKSMEDTVTMSSIYSYFYFR